MYSGTRIANARHRVKFRQNRSNDCRDIAIFSVFQNGGRRHLGFSKIQILPAGTLGRPNLRKPAKFHQDRPIRCWDMANFRFFKMAAVRHFGFVVNVFKPPTKSTWWSLSLCKNCWNRCTGFDSMHYFMILYVRLENAYSRHQYWGLGAFDPLNGHR